MVWRCIRWWTNTWLMANLLLQCIHIIIICCGAMVRVLLMLRRTRQRAEQASNMQRERKKKRKNANEKMAVKKLKTVLFDEEQLTGLVCAIHFFVIAWHSLSLTTLYHWLPGCLFLYQRCLIYACGRWYIWIHTRWRAAQRCINKWQVSARGPQTPHIDLQILFTYIYSLLLLLS